MYIYFRLCEIFDARESENGWFGKKHLLIFGDVLQLPPVNANPPYMVSLEITLVNTSHLCLSSTYEKL